MEGMKEEAEEETETEAEAEVEGQDEGEAGGREELTTPPLVTARHVARHGVGLYDGYSSLSTGHLKLM